MYQYHEAYNQFMNSQRIAQLDAIFEQIGDDYTPDFDNVLRFMQLDPSKLKVVIMGQDPYYTIVNQQKVANGRSFQPATLFSWSQTFRQVSLKNIVRLIYKSYTGQLLPYSAIVEKDFIKLSPELWFDSLEKQGVLFLNAALTTKINQANAHRMLWQNFINDLIQYLDNYPLIWFLWGKNAQSYDGLISGKKYRSNHPMMCNINNPHDFLNNQCFIETMDIIDYRGVENV